MRTFDEAYVEEFEKILTKMEQGKEITNDDICGCCPFDSAMLLDCFAEMSQHEIKKLRELMRLT